MNMRIIDVSKHNGPISWTKIASSGISGVIIRAGYGRSITQKDKSFEEYYAGAIAAGLHIGAYWYSYADSPTDASTEAKVFLSAIDGKKFDLPVYLDIEEQKHVKMSKETCSAIITSFCTTLEKAGYYAGVYSFDSFFNSNVDKYIPTRFITWVARVENILPTYCTTWGIHQYSWKGKIDGISGDVDMNYCRIDYPKIIKKACLNGYKKEIIPTYAVTARKANLTKDDANRIADECGKLGMSAIIAEEDYK